MPLVGAHVSISKSISCSFERAKSLGCTAFQIFTRNPRGWKSKRLEDQESMAFLKKLKETKLFPVAHMPYLPNLASPNAINYERSTQVLVEELNKCEKLEIPYLVAHLGSHMGTSENDGIRRIAEACNKALESSHGNSMILFENTAGQKNSVGHTLEQLRQCMDMTMNDKRIGICYDTCHGFAAGYDIRTPKGSKDFLQHFDSVIGLESLRTVHANDSKGDLNSHLDRHEHIGKGKIGLEGFNSLLSNDVLKHIPVIIETPYDTEENYLNEIAILRKILSS